MWDPWKGALGSLLGVLIIRGSSILESIRFSYLDPKSM